MIWTNELGKGNSHTLNDIPFVLAGNGLDFKMGRSLKYKSVPHNRLCWRWPTEWATTSKSSATPTCAGVVSWLASVEPEVRTEIRLCSWRMFVLCIQFLPPLVDRNSIGMKSQPEKFSDANIAAAFRIATISA